MGKRIGIYFVQIIIAFCLVYGVHQSVIAIKNFHFSLFSVYLFHAIASLFIYLILEAVAYKMANQTGYAYLAAIFLKIGFFVLLFQGTVFAKIELDKLERVSLIIPLFLFLILEAIAVSKLLNLKM